MPRFGHRESPAKLIKHQISQCLLEATSAREDHDRLLKTARDAHLGMALGHGSLEDLTKAEVLEQIEVLPP